MSDVIQTLKENQAQVINTKDLVYLMNHIKTLIGTRKYNNKDLIRIETMELKNKKITEIKIRYEETSDNKK